MTEQGTFCPLFREARTVWEFNFTFFVCVCVCGAGGGGVRNTAMTGLNGIRVRKNWGGGFSSRRIHCLLLQGGELKVWKDENKIEQKFAEAELGALWGAKNDQKMNAGQPRNSFKNFSQQ